VDNQLYLVEVRGVIAMFGMILVSSSSSLCRIYFTLFRLMGALTQLIVVRIMHCIAYEFIYSMCHMSVIMFSCMLVVALRDV